MGSMETCPAFARKLSLWYNKHSAAKGEKPRNFFAIIQAHGPVGGFIMLETIRNRRSVRQFTSDPVTQEQVEKLLEAGIMAPSAMNKQPWHFIVCRDREMMERFQTVHPYSKIGLR